MLARLETHLGPGRLDRAEADEPAMGLDFRIDRRDGVSHGTLTLVVGGASVERAASSRSCADVVAALSMMAAIAIGEEAALAPAAPPEEPRPIPRPAATRNAKPTKEKRASAPAPRADAVKTSAGAGVEINGNRGAVPMAKWFAQVHFPGAPFQPTVVLGLARSATERIRSPRGAIAVRWSEISVDGCVDLVRAGALGGGPCINVDAGALEATVIAPLPARAFSYLWLSAGASAKIAWRVLPALSVELAAGARVPLVRSELFFEPDTDAVVYRAPVIVPFTAAGFVAHLP